MGQRSTCGEEGGRYACMYQTCASKTHSKSAIAPGAGLYGTYPQDVLRKLVCVYLDELLWAQDVCLPGQEDIQAGLYRSERIFTELCCHS